MNNRDMSKYFETQSIGYLGQASTADGPARETALESARVSLDNALLWARKDQEGCDITYEVTYYDAKLSKKGRGTQTAVFTKRDEAIDFASKNRYRAKPCKVIPRVTNIPSVARNGGSL